MTTRAMGPMAGIGWLTRAINVGRNGPGAVFGGASLMAVVALLAALAVGVAQAALVFAIGDSIATLIISSALMGVLVLVLMAMMLVGFLRLLHKVESGLPARALDVFSGFGDFSASLRTIGLMLLLTIAQYVIIGIVLVTFAGGFLSWYMQVMQASMAGGVPDMTTLPTGMGIVTLTTMVLGLVFYGIQAIALGQIILRRRGLLSALGDGVIGALKNLLPLLVFVIACIVGMILLLIAVFIVVLVVGMLAKFVSVWLGVALAVPLYIAFVLTMFVVGFGAMYHLWRDVCGDGEDTIVDPVSADVVTV